MAGSAFCPNVLLFLPRKLSRLYHTESIRSMARVRVKEGHARLAITGVIQGQRLHHVAVLDYVPAWAGVGLVIGATKIAGASSAMTTPLSSLLLSAAGALVGPEVSRAG